MSIAETIQSARKSAGLTQEQLAARVYVTRQAVSRWETGESEPSIDMRKLLASVLDVPVTDLFDLPDAPSCRHSSAKAMTSNAKPHVTPMSATLNTGKSMKVTARKSVT